MAGKPKKPSFEQKMQKLEKIIAKLDTGDIGLEESLALYESGVKLLKECHKTLDTAEKKLEILTKRGDAPVTETADPEDYLS